MKYANVRDQIKSGDVLGFSHRIPFWKSWYDFKIAIVRMCTRSEYSHVGIALVFGGRVFVLESVTGGVRLIPLSLSLPCYLASDDELDEAGIERALSICGQPYSELEAVLGEFDKTDDTNGVWQCSEAVKWWKQLPCKATPAAIMQYLLEKGSGVQYIEL